MTEINLLFLKLISNALGTLDFKTECLSAEQWLMLYNLSNIHHLCPTLYYGVKNIAASDENSAAVKAKWKKQAQVLCVRQTIVYSKLSEIMARFAENGLSIALLKGPILAQYYPDPYARLSGDIDLFTPVKSQYEKADEIIRNFENCVLDKAEANVSSYTIDGYTNIELHKNPFAEEKGRFFEHFSKMGCFLPDSFCKAKILDMEFLIPSSLDMAIYLVCHMAQHFVFSGFGIRHIIDLMLFLRNNRDKIDLSEFEKSLEELELLTFYRTCLLIGVKYLHFTDFSVDFDTEKYSQHADELLEDVVSAGVFGYVGHNRMQSGAVVEKAFTGESGSKGSMLRKLFPTYAAMAKRYPYCKKHPVLLPVAYISRFLFYKKSSGENISQMMKTAAQVSEISAQRLELLKKLDMLP
ncbi:MAG: nucleotidyltransferase family protein [Clostridia bacterium]|nr:nucleotidyltransferase family protein [Clostridia bacterium]